MGAVQAEVLRRQLSDRFGLEADFGTGGIVCRETIAAPVEGVGHFEPLRHYAEVHLLLEPLPPGSGIEYASACSTDVLALNWQRLILTHLAEKAHRGVLTGSAVTDLRFTILTGRSHLKHTEGGDFRQATYRAVRQGLRKADSVLLEPWYDFRLEVPTTSLGRALSDLQRMGGECDDPVTVGEESVLTGAAPVSQLRDYAAQVTAYTRGMGRLTCTSGGYRPCADQDTVVAQVGYDPDRDVEDPCGSVFCAHGAGFNVPWNQVEEYMHLEGLDLEEPEEEEASAAPAPTAPKKTAGAGLAADRELQAIFEKTYGPIKPRAFQPPPKPARHDLRDSPSTKRPLVQPKTGPEYLLVDGYNIIFAWEELTRLARQDLDVARKSLMDLLSNYQGYRKNRVILVFDAYKVPQGTGSVTRYHNIHVVYTREAETADQYIERLSFELRGRRRVRVATSDNLEQLIILGHGAERISAQHFHDEVYTAQAEIERILSQNNQKNAK